MAGVLGETSVNYPRLMLLGMSIHHLDQFRFLFGEPEEVTAITATYPGQPWAGESIAFYTLRYAKRSPRCRPGRRLSMDPRLARQVPDRGHSMPSRAVTSAGSAAGTPTLEYTTSASPDSWVGPPSPASGFPMPSRARWASCSARLPRTLSRRPPDATTWSRSASSRLRTDRPRPSAAPSPSRRLRLSTILAARITALITPCSPDGSVDFGAIEPLVSFQRAAGVRGLFVLGTAGGGPLLAAEERAALTRAILAAADDGCS